MRNCLYRSPSLRSCRITHHSREPYLPGLRGTSHGQQGPDRGRWQGALLCLRKTQGRPNRRAGHSPLRHRRVRPITRPMVESAMHHVLAMVPGSCKHAGHDRTAEMRACKTWAWSQQFLDARSQTGLCRTQAKVRRLPSRPGMRTRGLFPPASTLIGDSGLVYALDRRQEAMLRIKEKIMAGAASNILPMEADIRQPLPIADGCVDVCLLFTVLHIPQVRNAGPTLFTEIRRVLKHGGRLAIIECKKEEQDFGPPIHMRLSPQEIDHALDGCGLKRISLADMGFNYMVQYAAQ